jgi:hypothetical protein
MMAVLESQHGRPRLEDGPRTKRETKRTGNPYEKPTVTKLTPEEAKAKLLDAANRGDQGAKDLLEMMSPEEKTKDKKKSA